MSSIEKSLSNLLSSYGKFVMTASQSVLSLHKRIQNISAYCLLCLNAEENLEHLFFLCPLARAVWFGIDLSIRIDSFAINNIKNWIYDWLSKPELLGLDALWFYGQFVCTLYGSTGTSLSSENKH